MPVIVLVLLVLLTRCGGITSGEGAGLSGFFGGRSVLVALAVVCAWRWSHVSRATNNQHATSLAINQIGASR